MLTETSDTPEASILKGMSLSRKGITRLSVIEAVPASILFPVKRFKETAKAVSASSGAVHSEFMSFYSLVTAAVFGLSFFVFGIIGLVILSLLLELIAAGALILTATLTWLGFRHLRLYETNLQQMFRLNSELLSTWLKERYGVTVPEHDLSKIIAFPNRVWMYYHQGEYVEIRYSNEEAALMLVDKAGQELPHS